MKTFLVLASAMYLGLLNAGAQQIEGVTHSGRSTGQAPFPLTEYTELSNPVKTDMQLWQKVRKVNVGWGTIDIRYKKEVPAMSQVEKKIQLDGWKGERVSAQFVVWGNKNLDNLSFEVTELKHQFSKKIISSDCMLKGFVRYVMTDELNKDGRGGCGARPNSLAFDSTLVADPIDHLTKSLVLPAYASQGCWIRVQIPSDATAGIYTGKVIVRNGEKVIDRLSLKVRVINRSLPAVNDWKFHLDLWQNPYAVARYHQVEPWSEAHLQALKPYMELYRNAGGKVITASIMHKPWNAQTFDYFESMVTWVKKLDGSWAFDYAVFDRWVQFMLDLGIDKQINCYSMVPWKLSFQYFDQATNQMKFISMKPGDEVYDEVWGKMLTSFAAHLKEKGWFDKTFISMDERPLKVMQATLNVIKKADAGFKISLAGALHNELVDDLDDYCVALRMKYTDEQLAKRKAEGKVTTYYTSCEEPYPNTFTFAAPSDSEWLGWYAAKANLDGYLRWALNSWVIEPLLDSRFYTWAAGDTYMIYPGGRTSMRFERLAAGIQAYEKVRILKKEFKAAGNLDALKTIEETLNLFDEAQLEKVPSSEVVKKANQQINSL